jgi:hypothetical protein
MGTIINTNKGTLCKAQSNLKISLTQKAALSLIVLFNIAALPAMACEACQKQQPKIFQGITHGAGPSSNWDYVIVVLMVIITVYTLVVTVKRVVKPEENDSSHIKRMIFNQ